MAALPETRRYGVSIRLIMIVVIIMIIVFALKGANYNSYNFLTAPQTVSNTYAGVARAQLCANDVQHRTLITCNMSCATWQEGTAQLLSLTELKAHLF